MRKGFVSIILAALVVAAGAALGYLVRGELPPRVHVITKTRFVTHVVTKSLLPQNYSQCEVYASDHEALIVIFGGGSVACETWIQERSAGELFWTSTPQSAYERSVICTVANGIEDVAVLDGGGQAIGHDVCSSLVREGWVLTNPPEEGL